MTKTKNRKFLLSILASGFGKRFGSDKLMAVYNDKRLFTYMIEALKEAWEVLNEKLPEASFDIAIVTNNDRIREYIENTPERLICLDNPRASEGISESIKRSVEYAMENDYTDIGFFLADMPELGSEDIISFISNFIKSKKVSAIMCADGVFSNPAAIRLSEGEKLMGLYGDKGAIKIICAQKDKLYIHPIDKYKLFDIDKQNDLCGLYTNT